MVEKQGSVSWDGFYSAVQSLKAASELLVKWADTDF